MCLGHQRYEAQGQDGPLRLVCHPELKNGTGAWGFQGEEGIHRTIRKADVWYLAVCSVIQMGHSDKSYLW